MKSKVLSYKYAITLQVPPNKKVTYNGEERYYTSLTFEEQKDWFMRVLNKWSFTYKVFELTKHTKRVHLHGLIEFKEVDDWELFHNELIPIFTTPKRDIDYCLRIVSVFDEAGWYEYMKKEEYKRNTQEQFLKWMTSLGNSSPSSGA